ncbi:MAG: RloB family protein [Eubacteriales bacterium]|nr:RloB family protein [Eubacteriales bacterium]
MVFDRDRVENFDNIIAEANSKGIKVGWSNPCIEIWFCAYFNVMPALTDSVKCCKRFGELFRQATEQIYQKTDRSIYNKLCRYGNEKAAISAANQKLAQHDKNCVKKPSEMCSSTTIQLLVEEIKNKTELN